MAVIHSPHIYGLHGRDESHARVRAGDAILSDDWRRPTRGASFAIRVTYRDAARHDDFGALAMPTAPGPPRQRESSE